MRVILAPVRSRAGPPCPSPGSRSRIPRCSSRTPTPRPEHWVDGAYLHSLGQAAALIIGMMESLIDVMSRTVPLGFMAETSSGCFVAGIGVAMMIVSAFFTPFFRLDRRPPRLLRPGVAHVHLVPRPLEEPHEPLPHFSGPDDQDVLWFSRLGSRPWASTDSWIEYCHDLFRGGLADAYALGPFQIPLDDLFLDPLVPDRHPFANLLPPMYRAAFILFSMRSRIPLSSSSIFHLMPSTLSVNETTPHASSADTSAAAASTTMTALGTMQGSCLPRS